jgi:hypothetical protein
VVGAGVPVEVGVAGAGVPAELGVAVGVVGPELVSAGDVAAPGVDGPELALVVGATAELANQRPLTRLPLCGPPQAAYRLPHLGEV